MPRIRSTNENRRTPMRFPREEAERAASLFKVLSEPRRLLATLLLTDGARSISDLSSGLNELVEKVRADLTVLRDLGIVREFGESLKEQYMLTTQGSRLGRSILTELLTEKAASSETVSPSDVNSFDLDLEYILQKNDELYQRLAK